MTDIDVDHLRLWVGRERRLEETLDPFPARGLAAALDHDNLPERGEPLPPSWHWLYFLETPRASATDLDGHPHKGGFLPPVPLPRRMWAAGAVDIAHPLLLGVPAEKISTIRSVELKSGRTGRFVLVGIEHRLRQEGRLCLREEQTLAYRALPAAPPPPQEGEPASPVADWTREVAPDPVLMFRFSALTYNSHRIHYDRDYATRVEFYAGLVVHAPLLVTLLLDLFSRSQPGVPLTRFSFRAVRPTLDLGPFQLRGKRTGRNVALWSADHENRLSMSAEAVCGARPDA
jgi:3-methylfumaryl-CoA hydratase